MTRRILHVVQSFASGVATAMTQYAAATPQFEHHLLHAATSAAYVPDGELTAFASRHVVENGLRSGIGGVRERVRDLRPDVVHAHSSFGGAFARLAVRSSPRLRIVYTPHCYGFERRDQSPAVLAGYRLAERVLARNTWATAACSPREAALAARLSPRGRVTYVPNVALPMPRPEAVPPQGPPRVVGIGRLSPQKDPGFFRDTIGLLRAARPDVEAIWIGDGDEQRRRALEADGIRVTGWMPRTEGLRLASTARAYLHTALWEGFPVAVLECTQLGMPVVARRIAAFDGLDAPALVNDPAAAADALGALLDEDGAAGARNHAGWASALSDNTPTAQSTALTALYG